MNLFGLALAPLYFAIATVESDRGATSENVYQIRAIYVDDLNRIYPEMRFVLRDVLDVRTAETMMYLYWQYYARMYQLRTGEPITYEVLARIHNGGPRGAERDSTLAYWLRVKNVLEQLTKQTNEKE